MANNPPVITAAQAAASVVEDASFPQAVELASGSIAFADADATDTHSATVAFVASTLPGGAELGALAALVTQDANGQGVVGWTYSVPDALLRFLALGQSFVETFDVTIADGHGGTALQRVSVTVNAAPSGPVAHAATLQTGEDSPVAFDPLASVTDIAPNAHVTVVSVDAVSAKGAAIGSVLSFDDLPDTTPLPAGYGGFDWTVLPGSANFYGANTFGDADALGTANYGLYEGAGHAFSGTNVLVPFNGVEDTAIRLHDHSAFLFEGAWMAREQYVEFVKLTAVRADGSTVSETFDLGKDDFSDDFVRVAFDPGLHVGQITELQIHSVDAQGNATPGWWKLDDFSVFAPQDQAIGSSVQYDPNASPELQALAQGETTTDTFSYTVRDDSGATSTATVTVVVTGVNDPPVAHADAAATNEDTAVDLDVLANDTDIDHGAVLSVAGVDARSAMGAALAVNAGGTIRYDPGAAPALQALAQGETATDTFRYVVTDEFGATATTTVTVTVTGVNDAPAGVDDAATTDQNQAVTIDVLANDTDPDHHHVLSIVSVNTTGTAGLVSIVNGRIVYNPNGLPAAHIDPATLQDVPAVDSFTYVLADEFGATAAATVTVTVRPFDLTTANDVVNFATDGHNHTVNAVIGAPGTATLNSGDQLTGGAGSDTLAIVGDNAAFSLASLATFSGFEAVRLDGTGESLTLRNGASLTVNGGSGNTVTLSTSGDVVRFAGGSNTVNATIGGTLNAGDSLTGGSGVDTLVLTNGGTANLNALAAFAGFEAVRLAGTGETLVLRNGVDLAVAAGSNNTVTLGTGSDAVTFAGGTNTVNATAATLNAGDRLLGGSNTDTLALSGAGSFDLSALATFSGFEAVALDRNLGETLVLRNGVNLAVTGASNDTVTLGTGNETVSFTGGTNTVNAVIGTGATLGAADRLSGGGGTDTLALTGDGGALDLNTLATFTGFERVSLGGAGEILTLRNGTSLTVLGGHGNAVVLGSGSDTVSFTDGANTVTAATATLNGGDSLAGGTGTDTLVLTGGGSFNLNAIAGLSGFETVSLTQPATLILRNGAGLAATGSAAGDTITGGTGNDTIAGAGGADSLSGGAGADHFVYTAAGGGAQSSVQTGLDVIADFAHGTDKIDLNGFAFTPLEKALTADAAVNGFTGGSVANYFHAAAADGPAIKVEYLNGTTQAQVYVDVNRDGNFDKATDIAIHLNNIAATAHLTLGDFSFG